MRREEFDVVYEQGPDAVFAILSAMQEQIAELERRLNQNSRNSSMPPSSDPLAAPKRKRRKDSGRKQGGQRGHKGSHRKLVADPDETEDHFPDECDCGHHFSGEEPASGNPARHQVTDLPETSVITTEHRLHRLRCPRCGKRVRASLPAGIERGAFGPRLRATIVTMASMMLSRRGVKLLLAEMFGLELSTGSVEKVLKDAGGALAAPWEAIRRVVQSADVAHADETPGEGPASGCGFGPRFRPPQPAFRSIARGRGG